MHAHISAKHQQKLSLQKKQATKQKKIKSKKCIEKGKNKLGILQIFYDTSMING